ncbi:unnamed protein product [Echinostoma caproni]|uniref:Uncharacterized protein n=1 Tax=Echinostoma caproni TaxID=27848 RepID=A0A3P8I537_9TREM|nr:unnamed protein product [Echinostoma caproni]
MTEFVGTAALAAKPRESATRLISSTLVPAIIAPLWLRPGSGRLRVYLYLDGMTRVLRVEDAADESSLLDPADLPAVANLPESLNSARWGNPLFIERFPKKSGAATPWLNRQLSNSPLKDAPHFKATIVLPYGIGVSVISAFAEELIYASLLNIRISFNRLPNPDTSDAPPEISSPQGLEGLNLATDVLQQHSAPTYQAELNSSDPGTSTSRSRVGSGEWDMGCTDFRAIASRSYFAESVEMSIGHIQIDSQFPGALFPVLLFTDHFDVENSMPPQLSRLQPPSVQPTAGRRAKNRVLAESCASEKVSSKSTPSSALVPRSVPRPKPRPTLLLRFEREVQNRWDIRISPIVIQAEELLLLKLIQFWQRVMDPLRVAGNYSVTLDEPIHPRANDSPVTDNGTLLWFDHLWVAPIIIRLSVQTAKNSLTSSNLSGAKRLLPSLMSFTNADVQLGSVDRVHVLESLSCLLEQLNTHYHMQLLANAVHIFGSVDFLGNPIGLINDLTSGISGLVDLDVGSLIRHVAHGVGDSTSKNAHIPGTVYVVRGILVPISMNKSLHVV